MRAASAKDVNAAAEGRKESYLGSLLVNGSNSVAMLAFIRASASAICGDDRNCNSRQTAVLVA